MRDRHEVPVRVFRSTFSQQPLEDAIERCFVGSTSLSVQSLERLHVFTSRQQHHHSRAQQQHSKGWRSVLMGSWP